MTGNREVIEHVIAGLNLSIAETLQLIQRKEERLRCVWVGWGVAKYNLDGYLHWGGNYWTADPYKQSVVKQRIKDSGP